MTVFTMFFIELMASRFEIFGQPGDLDAADPTKIMLASKQNYSGHTVALEEGKSQDLISLVSICFPCLLRSS